MKGAFLIIPLMAFSACANTDAVQMQGNVRASGFIVDPDAPEMVVKKGSYIYDPKAPAIHARNFVIEE